MSERARSLGGESVECLSYARMIDELFRATATNFRVVRRGNLFYLDGTDIIFDPKKRKLISFGENGVVTRIIFEDGSLELNVSKRDGENEREVLYIEFSKNRFLVMRQSDEGAEKLFELNDKGILISNLLLQSDIPDCCMVGSVLNGFIHNLKEGYERFKVLSKAVERIMETAEKIGCNKFNPDVFIECDEDQVPVSKVVDEIRRFSKDFYLVYIKSDGYLDLSTDFLDIHTSGEGSQVYLELSDDSESLESIIQGIVKLSTILRVDSDILSLIGGIKRLIESIKDAVLDGRILVFFGNQNRVISASFDVRDEILQELGKHELSLTLDLGKNAFSLVRNSGSEEALYVFEKVSENSFKSNLTVAEVKILRGVEEFLTLFGIPRETIKEKVQTII